MFSLFFFKLSSPKDYVIHIVRTPEPVEDQVGVDDEAEGAESTETSTRKRRKSQTKPASLEAMNELWASTHAKQVIKKPQILSFTYSYH